MRAFVRCVAACMVLMMPLAGVAIEIKGSLLKPVRVTPKEGRVDEVLVGAAQCAGVNLMCDTTHVDQQLDTAELDGPLGHVLGNLARAEGIGISQLNDDVFLAWARPELAPLMVRARQAGDITRSQGKLSARELGAKLKEWAAQRAAGHKGAGLDQAVPLDLLPAELRDEVVAYAQERLLEQANRRKAHIPGVYDQEFWDKARVWVQPQEDQGRLISVFRLGVRHDDKGQWGRTIGWQM